MMLLKILVIFLFASKVHAFSYQHIWHEHMSSIHVLIVDPKEHKIVPVKASSIAGRETVQVLSKRYGAIAAVNGGFWKVSSDPAGILKIEGVWLGTSKKPRGAIGWSLQNPKVCMDRIVLTDSLEVIPKSDPPYTTTREWEECEHIIGGTPLLIQKGNIIKDYTPEQTIPSFLTYRHARTAIGIRPTGEWIFVVVDSLPLGGMSIPELAKFLHGLGCTQAVNLDGGGSSTLIIEGRLINSPKKIYAEAVSDAILIF